MKRNTLFLALLSVLLIVLAGCAHERVVVRPAQTNFVALAVTNEVSRIDSIPKVTTLLPETPGAPPIVLTNWVSVTNLVSEVRTNVLQVIVPEVAYTNVSLAPGVTAAAQLGGSLAPVPWAGAATGIATTLAGVIFGWINNRRKNEALGRAQTWQNAAGVLVENFEDLRKAAKALPAWTPDIDRKVMQGIQIAQALAGVKPQINALVEENTDFTHKV